MEPNSHNSAKANRGHIFKLRRDISPFWYKRICELTLFVSLVIIGLYFVGRLTLGQQESQSFFIPILSVSFAWVSAAFSVWTIIFKRQKTSYTVALIAYLLVTMTGATLIVQTGDINSPFVALWLLIGACSGLFGSWVWIAIFLISNGYAAYELFFTGSTTNVEYIIKLFLIAEAPLIASFVIWHNEAKHTVTKDSAYNALQQQLSQVADKSQIVINSIDDGVVAINAEGVIELINPAAQTVLGWPKQDAIGLDYKSVIKLVDPKGVPITDALSPIQQVVISNRSLTNNQLCLLTKNSKKIFISLMVSPVGDNAQAGGVIAVFRDITNEKEQERQRGEFISTASHEMRTPVAAIEGYLALAMNPQTAVIDDKAKAYLKKAYESTQHLGRLFQDLLTVSRAEDGRLVPHPTVIDAVAFTREISEGLLQKAQSKNIGLLFAPGNQNDTSKRIQPIYYVFADPGHLREVVNNLIDNAIKYTKQGTVTVDVKGDTNNVVLSVTDTGIGVPPEDIPHLFQKFYRVDNSDTREIGGTGLGLYICRRLIEANNGHMGVESIFGKGSTFTVQLPRMTNDQASGLKQKEDNTVKTGQL